MGAADFDVVARMLSWDRCIAPTLEQVSSTWAWRCTCRVATPIIYCRYFAQKAPASGQYSEDSLRIAAEQCERTRAGGGKGKEPSARRAINKPKSCIVMRPPMALRRANSCGRSCRHRYEFDQAAPDRDMAGRHDGKQGWKIHMLPANFPDVPVTNVVATRRNFGLLHPKGLCYREKCFR